MIRRSWIALWIALWGVLVGACATPTTPHTWAAAELAWSAPTAPEVSQDAPDYSAFSETAVALEEDGEPTEWARLLGTETDMGADPEMRRVLDRYLDAVQIDPRLTRKDAVASLRAVDALLESDAVLGGDDEAGLAREMVRGELLKVIDQLDRGAARTLWSALQQGGIQSENWKYGQPGTKGNLEIFGLFLAANGDARLPVMGKEGVAGGRPGSETFYAFFEADATVSLRAAAHAVHRMLTNVIPVDEVYEALVANDTAWANYAGRGFSQYPWEYAFNDMMVDASWDDAPRSQWILLHPELAYLVKARSAREVSGALGVVVHGLGWLAYPDDERSYYAGASLSVGLSGEEGDGLAFGPTLHLGRTTTTSAVPHLSLGFLWQAGVDDSEDGLLLALSVDLFGMFSNPDLSSIRSDFDL